MTCLCKLAFNVPEFHRVPCRQFRIQWNATVQKLLTTLSHAFTFPLHTYCRWGPPNASPPTFEPITQGGGLLYEGSDAKFQVKVHGNPPPEVVFTRRGMPLRNDPRRQVTYDPTTGICCLHIRNLTAEMTATTTARPSTVRARPRLPLPSARSGSCYAWSDATYDDSSKDTSHRLEDTCARWRFASSLLCWSRPGFQSGHIRVPALARSGVPAVPHWTRAVASAGSTRRAYFCTYDSGTATELQASRRI